MTKSTLEILPVLFALAFIGFAAAEGEGSPGKIGDERSGPKQGEVAPDFTLNSIDRKKLVSLSDFRNDKPVVLIFGSYT